MRPIASLAAVILLAACGNGTARITGPVEQLFIHNGLEQQLTVTTPDATDPDGDWFHLSSRIVNRSDEPVTVHVVTCWLDPRRNLRTRAPISTYGVPDCPPNPGPITLAPGEASPSAGFSGRISRPGRYTIHVRQSLDPEFWGSIRVTAR